MTREIRIQSSEFGGDFNLPEKREVYFLHNGEIKWKWTIENLTENDLHLINNWLLGGTDVLELEE